MNKYDQKKQIKIGKVTGAVGLRGDIRIFHEADDPSVLLPLMTLIIDGVFYDIVKIRYKKKIPIISLSGITDRNAAEALVQKDIFVETEMLPELSEGSYYIKDLLDLKVVSASDGTKIGVIKNVITGTSQDTYEILTEDGKVFLLPAVTEFVIKIDLDTGMAHVNLPDGIEDIAY